MLIVDAQIHLWMAGRAPPHHRQAPYLMEEAVRDMRAAGVDRAINCPAIWDETSNDYAVEAARKHPDKLATLGWFPTGMEPQEGFVRAFVSQPGMKGLRFVLASPEQQDRFRAGRLEWIWEEADRLALPVGLAVPAALLPEVGHLAGRYPHVRWLIDHIGFRPTVKLPDAAAHLEDVLALARFPNIAVKASGVPSFATDPYPFASVHPVVRRTFDAFGRHRTFWGTDITRMPCSWAECVRMFTDEMPWLKGEDLDFVMGRGVCEWIGWR